VPQSFTDGVWLAEPLLDHVVQLWIFNQFQFDEVYLDLAMLDEHSVLDNLQNKYGQICLSENKENDSLIEIMGKLQSQPIY